MRKLLKILLYCLLAFVVIFLITIAIVPLIFDPKDYTLKITEAVQKQTGRRLEIEGDIKLQLLPKLAVTTGKMKLGNNEDFARETFAEIETGFFRIRLIPLFSKQIELKKIVLDGVKVHLIRAEDGRTNWSGLNASFNNPGISPIPIRSNVEPSGIEKAADSPLAALLAAKIDVFNAEMDFDDRLSGNRILVKDLNFIMDRFGFGRGVDFRITGNLTNAKPQFRETAAISGQLFVNENMDFFKVENFRWNSRIDGDLVPAEFSQAELTSAVELNLVSHTLSAPNLQFSSAGATINAQIHASQILANPTLEGKVSIVRANPAALVRLTGFAYTPKDPSASRLLHGDFALNLNGPNLVISNIALVLDGAPINGTAAITGLDSPDIQFNFSAPEFDVDRYLPESSAAPLPAEAGPRPGISVVEAEPPQPGNRNANNGSDGATIQGNLKLGSLRYRGLLAEEIQMAFHFSNGVLRSNQRFQRFYGGSLKGSVEFNNREREPVIALNQSLSDVAIGPLLQDLQGKKPVEGTLQSTIRLVGRGARLQTFKSTLNGDINATLTDGQIHGVSLDNVIRDSNNLLSITGLAPASAADVTKFSKVTFQGTVIDGMIDNTQLVANSTNFDFNGGGKINLADGRIDYRIEALMNNNPEGIMGIKIKELQGVRIPIQIGGTLSEPTFQPAVQSALDDPKVKSAAEKLKQKLDKKLGPGPRRLLENLF